MIRTAKYIGNKIIKTMKEFLVFSDLSPEILKELRMLKEQDINIWNALNEVAKDRPFCNYGSWVDPVISDEDFGTGGWSEPILFETEHIRGDKYRLEGGKAKFYQNQGAGAYNGIGGIIMDMSFDTAPSDYFEVVLGIFKNNICQANLARDYNAAVVFDAVPTHRNQFKFSLSGTKQLWLDCGDKVDLRIWHTDIDPEVAIIIDVDGHFDINYIGNCNAEITELNNIWRT